MFGEDHSDSESKLDGMDWMTIEANVRKIVMDLVDPIMKGQNSHKVSLQEYGKLIIEHNKRLETLEVAVFQANKPKTIFDEINSKLEKMKISIKEAEQRIMK